VRIRAIAAQLCILPTSRQRGVPAAVTEVFAQLLCGAQQLSDCKFWVRAALTWIACLTSQVSVIQDFFLCLRLGMKLE
jgi:hypothetical protein